MTSFFSWLDYSERERRQMLDVISRFREHDTRDELGIGSVRDAFADLLFPGTSTIQTRARYFLFIPWIYRSLENKSISSEKIGPRARTEEITLILALLNSNDTAGVIGRDAREKLQRLPSNIYWQGLGTWGIRLFYGSQTQYHRCLDAYYTLGHGQPRNDDGEPVGGRQRLNWQPDLPPVPTGFPRQASFALTHYEAEYLRERILLRVPDTLLAFFADQGKLTKGIEFPWKHSQYADFPDLIHTQLMHARNFSETIYGAVLLYNLMLAEARQAEELIEIYRTELVDWEADLRQRAAVLRPWAADLTPFWQMVETARARITFWTKRFITDWLTLATQLPSGSHLADQAAARDLIVNRERQLKHALARLDNPRALELWTGAAGVFRLDYRWGVTQTLVNDILRGLEE
jgi:hypothetical protein